MSPPERFEILIRGSGAADGGRRAAVSDGHVAKVLTNSRHRRGSVTSSSAVVSPLAAAFPNNF